MIILKLNINLIGSLKMRKLDKKIVLTLIMIMIVTINIVFVTRFETNNKIHIVTNIAKATLDERIKSRSKIMFTFDDGLQSVYNNVTPILTANNQRATVYVITNIVNVCSSTSSIEWCSRYMNWSELANIYNLGWDISSHTSTHPYLSRLDKKDLNTELADSYINLTAHGFIRSAKFIAYPYGDYNDNIINAVKSNGYLMGRTIEVRKNFSHLSVDDPDDLYYKMTVNYLGNMTTMTYFMSWVNQTIEEKGAMIFWTHDVADNSSGTNISTFRQMSNYVASRSADVDVVTMSEYYNYLKSR